MPTITPIVYCNNLSATVYFTHIIDLFLHHLHFTRILFDTDCFASGGYIHINGKYVNWRKHASWEGTYKRIFVACVYLCMVIGMYNNVYLHDKHIVLLLYVKIILVPFLESWKLVVKYWLTLIFLWIKHNEEASVDKTDEEEGRSSKDMHAVPIFPN